MPADYPYPTPFEMLRYLLRSFDFKLQQKDKKRLDEMTAKGVYDPRAFDIALEQYLSNVADKFIGHTAADQISKSLAQFISNYLYNVAGAFPADGLSRESVLDILIRTGIKDRVIGFVVAFNNEFGGPHPSFWFSSDSGSVDALFTWLSNNEPHWDAYLANIDKERRDMIAAWRRGNDLPSAQSLYLLSQPNTPNDKTPILINWDLIKPLLFLARSCDFIKRDELGCILMSEARLALWGAESKADIDEEIRSIQAGLLQSLGPAGSHIARLQFELRRTVEKSEPEQYQRIIPEVRDLINASEKFQQTDYWVDWHDARWHVFSGNLKKANELYKNAFEKAAFVAGENQKYIAEEAIVVAACQPKPDKVFLKQIKWVQVIFGYDIPSITSSEPSQKVLDNIEEWEIDLWRSSFDLVFPKAGLFPGVECKPSMTARGPLVLGPSEVKPDYRYPNRTIKVGDTWQRAMPQLVWFALNEDVEVCRNLIEKGADVNVKSEVGDTPILMALEALNVTEFNEANIIFGGPIYRTLNDETFKLISIALHDAKTINTRTQKKRLLPIISAVESGRLDIVEAILKMGADPNGRGKTDEQTALNVCLKLIGILKDPKLCKKHQSSMPVTPEALDSIRRQTQGLSSFTLDHQKKSFDNSIGIGLYGPIQQLCIDIKYKNIHQHMNVGELRCIASLLINSGANVNAEHASPVRGYTPLMLAVELDERSIFEQMLISGGSIKKTYRDPRTGRDISIMEIAKHFRSRGVEQVLKDISPYTTIG
ncbi:ankyrin repeat domain-containing protein [Microbulbifer sp. OS29]|uniref:Ankyrin repeat domain-containing protein n=1 Tax=Microbulbifer okhotskensis TaxID=2926617 RepID=A0A9X2EVN1_9GAMM|nr:ankyrin repeat domain-containing protein [Microbulbifer okhotskensis]MCO1336788.1 ankyrin repeat domain-containing protein [Microbulbifer okhotskensis]